MMYQRLMQATGKTLLSMVILISGAITNIILDPILIFGLCGCTALGIRGAAIATIIGQWISMFIGIVLQNAYNQEIKINLKRFHIKKEYVKCIYRVGFPTIVTQALQSMMVTGINIILQPFSASAVAFFGVYYKLQMFLFMPMNGLGQAAIAIIAFNYGAGNKKRIREVVRILYPVAGFIALCGAILFFAIPDKLLGLFSASDMMLIVGIPAIRVLAPTFLLASTTLISGYISSGFQDGITNMLGAIIRQFIPLLPSAWLFAACFGVNRVWYAFWISELCSFIFSILRIRKHITALKIDNSSSL